MSEAASFFVYGLLFVSLYLEVFFLVAFVERARSGWRRAAGIPGGPLPSVAVIVPCFNEEKTVGATLRSLAALEYPRELLEIILVDDGSTDGTLAAARSLGPLPCLRIFHKENGGKHTAMNYALERTDAEIVGCLDADSVVAPDALLKIVPLFADARVGAVTAGIHVREPRTILQHLQNVEYRLSVFNRFVFAALGALFITPGPFSFFRASLIRQLGLWRSGHSTEDMEMALRIQAAGHLIANAPKAVVHTATPATLRALLRQRVRWTYGWLRNAADYRYMIGNPKYGNLGLFVLPWASISIFTALFFSARVLWGAVEAMLRQVARVEAGASLAPHPSFDPFYFPATMMWFLVVVSLMLITALISLGSRIGTGSAKLPRGTVLFLLVFGLLAPLWLGAALARAALRTGVRWR